MKAAFEALGHSVSLLETKQEELLSAAIREKLAGARQSSAFDFVFSFNYFPEVALFCKEQEIPYVSWVYDNPCIQLYSYTVIFPTNHIFIFDSDTYRFLAGRGIPTVHFLPMAADPERLQKLIAGSNASDLPDMDIAFIGSLYTEEHNFYARMKGLPDHTAGYLRGLMDSQKRLYGYNLVEECLTPSILEDMHGALPLEPAADSVATREFLFAQYVINRQITAEERSDFLRSLGARHRVHVFCPQPAPKIPGCTMHGPVDPYSMSPRIFHKAKINLNISLRSIVNGIPLRCFEIMASGGFLLTNYQGDFGGFFVDGEDYVSFDSPESLATLTDYYLSHEEERARIAENGLKKIRTAHTLVNRAEEILQVVFAS